MCWMCVIHDFGADSAPQPGDQPNLLVLKLLIMFSHLHFFLIHIQFSPFFLTCSVPSTFFSHTFTSLHFFLIHIQLPTSFFPPFQFSPLFSQSPGCLRHSKYI